MKTHCVALMYHALYENEEEWHALLDEEKPYAISTQTFEQQLQLLKQWNIAIIHPNTLRDAKNEQQWQAGVLITFDDGHRSHVTHALPLLKKYDASGLFFITTGFTDHDPRFCSWQELTQLHEQGMAVHAHGHSHRFFADMVTEDAQQELKTSHDLIRRHISAPWSMSFPGGRYTQRDLVLAKAQGFTRVFTSDFDTVSSAAFQGHSTIPRFAIRNAIQSAQFKAMVMPSTRYLIQHKLTANLKKLIKSLLGNTLYHKLYTLKAKSQ